MRPSGREAVRAFEGEHGRKAGAIPTVGMTSRASTVPVACDRGPLVARQKRDGGVIALNGSVSSRVRAGQ